MYLKSLIDRGDGALIIQESYIIKNNFIIRNTSASKWFTMAGTFSTSQEAEIRLKMPKLNVTAHISAPFHVTSKKSNYHVIFGRDLLQELGTQLDIQNDFIGWKDIKENSFHNSG